MEYIVEHPQELTEIANAILQAAQEARIFLLEGDMGAGKTTFVKAICTALGVEDNTSSPTFSIVNEYHSPSGSVFHFDFYRLKDEQEAFDMGYEEYFYSGNYCFVEWPDKISNLIPEDARRISIEILSTESRKITFF